MKKTIFTALVALFSLTISAQQATTLYFLENAPMRHTINPAFQPYSNGYLNFTTLGWMSFGFGNNSFTLQDVLFVDPVTGKTITPLHPNANRAAFLRSIRSMTLMNGEFNLGLLNMGFRVKDKGYLTIGINERISAGGTLPKSIFEFLLDGGMKDLNGGINTIGLGGIGIGASAYTEIGFGYSHQINEKWTVGGKLKVLLGQAYASLNSRNLAIDASTEEWRIYGTTGLEIAAPINTTYFNRFVDGKNISQVKESFQDGSFSTDSLLGSTDPMTIVKSALKPAGIGAAIDLGFTYKPIENLQITAAITDLGFIYWNRGNRFTCSVDTVFEGAGYIDYGDPAYRDENGNFSTSILMDTVKSNLMGLLDGVRMGAEGNGFARMTSARLNIGIDANFWNNRVGVGIVSATRLYNARLYEEITLGAAFRPVRWFNLALSYSLMNNGKYSNIGAGLGFMPYDGINLTLAMDYIPTSFAGMDKGNGEKMYVIPDKAKMFNLALGFSICWGSNRPDKDKDGVWNKLDMCPGTPRGVAVDENGCPLDEDHDGVPDYQDHCLGTPAAAINFVDSVGCALDTDGDGVEDYLDQCPNTPEAAYGMVDEKGCPKDSDGDGVPDYLDECNDTPEAAYDLVDEKGCPLDSDGDGVPDYRDACPGTPQDAQGYTDEDGCELDDDGDGVPNYLDECPRTRKEAAMFVDEKGCDLDSDNDGIMDYEDECPNVAGVRANKGCPEIKREVKTLLEKAMQGIEFETGKSTILPSSYPLLDQIAQTFIDNPSYIIEVQGHTDNVGDPESNMKLSQDRADAVLLYLVKKGVSSDRLTSVGYGQEQPIADNSTKAGKQKNRRVQFKITFEEIHYETILDHADPQPEEEPATEE